ncbi:MAG: AmmeMemoRadiSam system protein B [bacterium]|nr:AmmeMemoRadiSam system protein B [bacterium]
MNVREPAVAGQFYPGNPAVLKSSIQKFLKSVPEKIEAKIFGLIVPHAGYEFSGQTASYAFKQIEGKKYDTVIIIGPSHQFPFRGAAVYPTGSFKTPLGEVEIDSSLAEAIISQEVAPQSKYITGMIEPHQEEHSLEVELPFLQTVLKEFKIVPICMGDQSIGVCKILADAIVKSVTGKSVLIVASSDFYHGYDYDECKLSVKESTSLICEYDIEGFHKAFTERGAACGGGAIVTCMLAAQKLGAKEAMLLYSTNSGDVTGMMSGYVVGYASFMLINPKTAKLSKEDKDFLLKLARNSITRAVTGAPKEKINPPEFTSMREKRGCFVTIKRNNELRGCIGYILPAKPLYQTVAEMAVEAAMGDPRFTPVSPEELAELKIEISVLSPLQRVKSIDEIQVGRDGLYIKKGVYSGLLLPQVATEYKWDRDKFIEQTCWKAGLPSDAWKEAEIYRFQAEVFCEEPQNED